jgi:hypothetical protein
VPLRVGEPGEQLTRPDDIGGRDGIQEPLVNASIIEPHAVECDAFEETL